MAPEQAKGKAADKRSDIWSFGVILFELLTGKRMFPGETVVEILGAVLNKEPDISSAPPRVHKLLRWCLEKDRKERLQSIGDARKLLAEDPAPVVQTPPPASRPYLPWAIAAVAISALGALLWSRPAAVEKVEARLTIPLPPGQELTSRPAITRDGRTMAYVTRQGTDDNQLYLRDLNSFASRLVTGSNGAVQPFFSPDGKWVAFFAQGQLKKVEVAGGAPVQIAQAPVPFGGAWTDDDSIIYSPSLGSGLWRVPANGGPPTSLTKPDGKAKGYAHVYPDALPGGKSIFFTQWGGQGGGEVLNLTSGQWEAVAPNNSSAAVFAPTDGSRGRILFGDGSSGMRSAPFDAANPVRTAAATSVLSEVYFDELGDLPYLAVSNTNSVVYAPGNPNKRSIVWVDRDGKVLEVLGKELGAYAGVSLAPDGSKVAIIQYPDIWIHDLARGTRSRIIQGGPDTGNNGWAVWSRDSKRLLFSSNRGGDWDVYWQPVDGSRPAEILLKRPYDQDATSVLSDGTLLYDELTPNTGEDLWTVSPDGKSTPLRVSGSNEQSARFSPGDAGARWVAYESDESGRAEIDVQAYPSGANRVAVSTGGGVQPRWSGDGKELFYLTGDALVAVAVRPDGSFGAPHKLFDVSPYLMGYDSYDVSADGKRFLMIRRDEGSVPRQLNVILNWSVQN